MLNSFGERLRMLREKKGISLNQFAKKIGQSPSWLSYLERGERETLTLSILEKIQEELQILPQVPQEELDNEISFRVNRAKDQFLELAQRDPQAAEYLLSNFENGIGLFMKNQKNVRNNK
jgi:transcriptional regulator with XRE-family HTH domain